MGIIRKLFVVTFLSFNVISFFQTSFSIAQQVPTGEGNGSSAGGDLTLERKNRIELFIRSRLKAELVAILPKIETTKIQNDALRNVVSTIIADERLLNDIYNTTYVSANCKDANQNEVDASTLVNVPASNICFNTQRLATQNAVNEDLVLLALHEHIHHFTAEFTHDGHFIASDIFPDINLRNDLNNNGQNLRFYLEVAAANGGILSERQLTTEWILVTDAKVDPITGSKIDEYVNAIIRANQTGNSLYGLEIIGMESEVAQLTYEGTNYVIKKESHYNTGSGSNLGLNIGAYTPHRFWGGGLTLYSNGSFQQASNTFFNEFNHYKKHTVVRYVITYRKHISTMSEEEYDRAAVDFARQFENDSREIFEVIRKWTAEGRYIPTDFLYRSTVAVELSDLFQIIPFKQSKSQEVTRIEWTSHDELFAKIYVPSKSFSEPSIEQIEDAAIGALGKLVHRHARDKLIEWRDVAERAYYAAKERGLPDPIARQVVRQFTATRDALLRGKNAINIAGGSKWTPYVFVDQSFKESWLLLSFEHEIATTPK
jgi:hypothetical protein